MRAYLLSSFSAVTTNDYQSFGSFGGDNYSNAGAEVAHLEPRSRERLYRSALSSLETDGACGGMEPRAVLDAVFSACIEDTQPFLRPPNASAFPPMPAVVAQADAAPPSAAPNGPTLHGTDVHEGLRADAAQTHPKWDEA